MLFDRPAGRLPGDRTGRLASTRHRLSVGRSRHPVPSAAACAVAAYGSDTTWRWPDRPLDETGWAALLSEAARHRIVGLLAAAVREGALPTTPRQRRALAPVVDRWMRGALSLERVALHTHRVLTAAGIEHRFLKGVALAHLDYASPDHRVFGDVDVVVTSGDIEGAVERLTEAVGPRVEPELRPGFDREFGKGATFASAGGDEVDLHRTLVWGALGLTVGEADLFGRPRRFLLADAELPALDPAAAFVHACYGAVLGDVPPRLVSLRDVVQTLPDGAEASRALELAAGWRAGAVVAEALGRVTAALRPRGEVHPLFGWAESYRPTPSEQLLLSAHLMRGGTYARRAAAVAVIPGLGARLRYVRASVWPSREYLASRGFGPVGHLRRSLRFVVPWRRFSA